MTLVGTKLYIIGGSYGQDYLKDIYELDTDPCPDFEHLRNKSASTRLTSMLADQRNQQEFSDITFMVEQKPYYAHKIVVSLLSERFRTMLQAGLSETQSRTSKTVVKIDEISYECFSELMKYLYTGKFDALDSVQDKRDLLDSAIEFLRVADVEVLDDVKIACELKLI